VIIQDQKTLPVIGHVNRGNIKKLNFNKIMTIKNYLKTLTSESDVKGLWYEDFSKDLDILSQFEEFKNVQIEFIKDIRKEPINSTIILKNLTRELFKTNIRLYSIWLDKQDVHFHISKNSLKNNKIL
jgi:hypothetical protein